MAVVKNLEIEIDIKNKTKRLYQLRTAAIFVHAGVLIWLACQLIFGSLHVKICIGSEAVTLCDNPRVEKSDG